MLAFLPESMLVLAIMGVGLAIIIGMSLRKGARIVGAILLFVILSPFIQTLFAALPLWILVLLLLVLGIQLLRTVLTFLFGHEATGHIVGTLVISSGRAVARLAFMPLRLFARGMEKLFLRFR